jgi:hypothetical protein
MRRSYSGREFIQQEIDAAGRGREDRSGLKRSVAAVRPRTMSGWLREDARFRSDPQVQR